MAPGIDLMPNSPSISAMLLTQTEKTTYYEMIGSLMYLLMMTCPNITYVVFILSQYLDSPHTTHLEAVEWVFKYLINTAHLQLVLGGHCLMTGNNTTRVMEFSDADWASHLHCHSISDFSFFIGIGVVSWSAKKQPIITLSSTESEYVALTHAMKDILWIHKLLMELSFFYNHLLPTTLHCDNQGTIELSKNSRFHAKMKNIDIHFHFICQAVDSDQIQVKYIPTDDMVTNIFTKSLAWVKFEMFRKLLNLIWTAIMFATRGSVETVEALCHGSLSTFTHHHFPFLIYQFPYLIFTDTSKFLVATTSVHLTNILRSKSYTSHSFTITNIP